jgi:hypothetical protein
MGQLQLVFLRSAALVALCCGCSSHSGGQDAGACAPVSANDGGPGPCGCTMFGAASVCDIGFATCFNQPGCSSQVCIDQGADTCAQAICAACSLADEAALLGLGDTDLLTRLCPGSDVCSLAMLQCFAQQGPPVLSPTCAAVFSSLFQRGVQQLGDGGGIPNACNPQYASPAEGTGINFCSAVGSCVGGSENCQQVICGACGPVDGIFLGGLEPVGFFGGLCPTLSPASPCSDFQCFIDAGPRVLSPNCATALTSLAKRFLDGGFDGG